MAAFRKKWEYWEFNSLEVPRRMVVVFNLSLDKPQGIIPVKYFVEEKMKKVFIFLFGIFLAAFIWAGGTRDKAGGPVVLMVWHDKGDAGINFIKELSELYQKTNPNVKIESLSFPTDQWFDKTTAALNTNTAPDIIFNDNNRLIVIQQNTGKLTDFSGLLKGSPILIPGDITSISYKGQAIAVPFQRVLLGLGVRKSWMEKTGSKFPETWDAFIDLAKQFTFADPDGNGKNDTFGFTVEGLKYLQEPIAVGAAGLTMPILNDEGMPMVRQPDFIALAKEYAKLYHEYKVVPAESATHTFTEMYQLIEGSKVGMFRAGNWNPARWDDVLKGDYIVGPFPQFRPHSVNGIILNTTRGVSVPVNAPHAEDAKKAALFLLTKEAQELSFKYFGASVDNDIKAAMSPAVASFYNKDFRMVTHNFPETKFEYFPKINERLQQAVAEFITNPRADVEAELIKAEQDMLQIIKDFQAKK
jgi:ABC-type glycerol-3-phosphate transport system substrate-binding protein